MGILERLFPPAKRDGFAQKLCDQIRRRGGSPVYDAAKSRISLGEGNFLHVENAYLEYQAAPFSMRKKIIVHYASFAAAPEEKALPLSEVRPHLLPRVRERIYFAGIELDLLADGAKPLRIVRRPLNDDLTLEVVFDTPQSTRSISESDWVEWGITFDEGLAIAKDNLWRISNEDFLMPRPGLYVSPWEDCHDASRLVLHDLIWQLKVKGDHIAAIPNRNQLIVTGSEDEEGLLMMCHLINAGIELPRFMTATLMRLNGTQWEPYFVPATHPAARPFRDVWMRSTANDYAEQKRLLEAAYIKTGRDVFVASFSVYEVGEEKTLLSRTSWIEDVDSMLPKTDELIIVRPASNGEMEVLGTVEWEAIAAITGELLLPEPDLFPLRFFTQVIPTREQLAAAGLKALPKRADPPP